MFDDETDAVVNILCKSDVQLFLHTPMTKPYLTNFTKFISIDATTSLTGQKFVTCAFGAEEGEVKEFTISVEDACDLLAGVVSALSSHGDETAIAIGDTFLRRVE